LQYIAYVYIKENQFGETPPPVFYNYHTDETIAPYCDSAPLQLPDKEFLEGEDDPMVEAFEEFNADKLHQVRSVKIMRRNRQASQIYAHQSSSIQTQVYTNSTLDIAIIDRIQEYNKEYVLDPENLTNIRETIESLRQEYAKIFDSIKTHTPNEKFTIEDYDEVTTAINLIADMHNQHMTIINQIIHSFNNQNPDLNYFQNMYNPADPRNPNDPSIPQAGLPYSAHDIRVHAILDSLIRGYRNILVNAKYSEKVFNSFADQTNYIRSRPASKDMNQFQIRKAISEMKYILPILNRFERLFSRNFMTLGSNLQFLVDNLKRLFKPRAMRTD
jgi:hypothetical protein